MWGVFNVGDLNDGIEDTNTGGETDIFLAARGNVLICPLQKPGGIYSASARDHESHVHATVDPGSFVLCHCEAGVVNYCCAFEEPDTHTR